MIILENDLVKATINPLGAEWTSFFDKVSGLEYMWQAGEAWPKHAPVLFPIVGALKNEKYSHKGKDYTLGRHGFARESLFVTKQISPSEAIFILESSEETKKIYPFDFSLLIRWTLRGKTLLSEYTISNEGSEELLYSFGLHPAFNLCFDPNQSIEDISLVLEKDEEWLVTAGLNADSTHYADEKSLARNILPLSNTIFDEDALVLEKLQSRALTIKSSAHDHSLTTTWSSNMPILGIWSKPKAPFVCIEPWAGICDHQDSSGILHEKKAICKLAPNTQELYTFSATIN
ncbi:MAG: aldose 1-epimerase family protein [Brevinema sp.]